MKTLFVVLILACVSAVAMGQVYKWTDAKGQVHFGDKPPVTGAEKLAVPSEPSMGDAKAARARALEQARKVELLERERLRREKAAAAERKSEAYDRKVADERRGRYAEYCKDATIEYDYYKAELRHGCDADTCDHYKKMQRLSEKEMKKYCQ